MARAVTPDLGKFRGPGRKADPCPYANLVVLKALSQVPALRDGDACRRDERYGVWGNPNTLSWLLRRLPTTFAAFVQRAVQARSRGPAGR